MKLHDRAAEVAGRRCAALRQEPETCQPVGGSRAAA